MAFMKLGVTGQTRYLIEKARHARQHADIFFLDDITLSYLSGISQNFSNQS
jgi:hypothetical protein